MQRTPRSIRRELTFYALAFAYSVSVIVGIIFVIQDPTLSRGKILSAIGLNIVSSVIFAIIFTSLGSRVQGRDLADNINDLFREHSQNLLGLIADDNKAFYPSVQYPPSSDFGGLFNRDLTNSLEQANSCFFRGPSPRYLPARIGAARRGPNRVYVAMLDPRSGKALTRRAVDRRQRAGSQGKTVEQLVSELREELMMSVVALFDSRHKCPIQVIFAADTSVTRSELFDDSIYISWYHGPSSPGTNFPETLRFPAGSIIYETLKLDMTRQFEVFDEVFLFDSVQGDDELLAHLTRLTGGPVTKQDVASWRQMYRDFIQPFESMLAATYQGSSLPNVIR